MTDMPETTSATVELTLQGNWFTSTVNPPRATVNGHRVPVKYGLNRIAVPAGRTEVEVWMQWAWQYGREQLSFDVTPGRSVPVFYAPPFHTTGAGRIGHSKQTRQGFTATLILVALFGSIMGVGVFVLLRTL